MTNSGSDQTTPREDVIIESVPSDLVQLHQQLEDDGGNWRASLPPADKLLQYMPPLRSDASSSSASDVTASQAGNASGTQPPHGALPFDSAMPRPHASAHRPLRGIAAGATAVVIIALFAMLLHGLAVDRAASSQTNGKDSSVVGARGTPTAQQQTTTAGPVQGKWQTMDGMGYITSVFTQIPYPVFSPLDPAIVYETSLSPIALRRSDDGGGTWQTLTMPSGSDTAIDIEIFASPLDARTAFLTVTVSLAYGQGTNACPSSAKAAYAGGSGTSRIIETAYASGQVPCSTTYRTSNAGKTWRPLSFPVNGTISTPLSDSAPNAGMHIQSQGTRLYALLDCGPSCVSPGGRLVTSVDGGLSWQVADAGGLGSGVCDFAAQPNSNTIYAAVSRGSCDVLNSPTLAIDRSDDAGQNWTHASYLPQGAVQGMQSVIVAGKPLLAVNVPAVSWQPHIIGVTQSATEFLVSTDRGVTWRPSPAQGVPTGARTVVAPLIIEADGSLVAAFAPTDTGEQAQVYSWKLGEKSWRMFAPAPTGQLSTLLRTASSSGGETLWAVLRSGDVTNNQFTFAVARYQV